MSPPTCESGAPSPESPARTPTLTWPSTTATDDSSQTGHDPYADEARAAFHDEWKAGWFDRCPDVDAWLADYPDGQWLVVECPWCHFAERHPADTLDEVVEAICSRDGDPCRDPFVSAEDKKRIPALHYFPVRPTEHPPPWITEQRDRAGMFSDDEPRPLAVVPDSYDPPPPVELPPSPRELAIRREHAELEVREEARRRLRAGTMAAPPAATLLSNFLAVPDDEARYRIDGLMPVGARIILSAQYKAGKSTTVGNLLRSLADGDPFLDRYPITPFPGRTVLLDTELDERMLRRWLRDQNIRNTDRIAVLPLRGSTSSLNLLDPAVRADWAATLRSLDASFVILDCLRPVLDALGLSEDKEAGLFAVAFDELLGAAGAAEAAVVHHMGHNGERSRGSSRLLDWPDVTWKLLRQGDDPAGARYFSAYGRDVNEPETELTFDPRHRRLTATGGTRKQAAAAATWPELHALLAEQDGLSGRQIEAALTAGGMARDTARGSIASAISIGFVTTSAGPRGAKLHHLTGHTPDSQRSIDDLIDPQEAAQCAGVRGSAPPRSEIECASAPLGRSHAHSLPPGEDDRAVRALTCGRCRQPAERLIPPDALCPSCAYPSGGAPEHDDEESAA